MANYLESSCTAIFIAAYLKAVRLHFLSETYTALACNEQKEDSDVDICVDMVPNLFRQAGVKIYLQELLNSDVDVVRMRESWRK